MRPHIDEKTDNDKKIWIISKGSFLDHNYARTWVSDATGPVMEYMISDLTRYLLNPNPIKVKKKLIGCEIQYLKPLEQRILDKAISIFPSQRGTDPFFSERIISEYRRGNISISDKILKIHVDKLYSLLRLYNPVFKKLSELDRSRIHDLIGICEEDIDGNHSSLSLKGDLDEKVNYISSCIGEEVDVILEKSFIAEGIFEMRGFDFPNFDPEISHRLIKYTENGKTKCCVLRDDNSVEYRVEDITLLHHMQLLEQTIETNAEFRASLGLCLEGNARPLRLLFNRQLAIDYSRANLPAIYQNVFEKHKIGFDEKEIFLDLLKQFQFGITFQCIPRIDSGEERLFTSISVMHDLRALEPLKNNLPQLYSEINSMAHTLEMGKFYLLDSIRGFKHE